MQPSGILATRYRHSQCGGGFPCAYRGCDPGLGAEAVDELGAIAIGGELAAARRVFAHRGNGMFGRWCQDVCGLSRTSAFRLLRARERFKECSTVEHSFDLSAIYALSSNGCPDGVRDEMVRRAEAGEHVSRKMVDDAIEQRSVRVDQHEQDPLPPRQITERAATGIVDLQRDISHLVEKWQGLSVTATEIVHALRAYADSLDTDSAPHHLTHRGPEAAAVGRESATSSALPPQNSHDAIEGPRTSADASGTRPDRECAVDGESIVRRAWADHIRVRDGRQDGRPRRNRMCQAIRLRLMVMTTMCHSRIHRIHGVRESRVDVEMFRESG